MLRENFLAGPYLLQLEKSEPAWRGEVWQVRLYICALPLLPNTLIQAIRQQRSSVAPRVWLVSALPVYLLRLRIDQLTAQPSLGIAGLAAYRGNRKGQGFCGFLYAQSTKISKLDNTRLALIECG